MQHLVTVQKYLHTSYQDGDREYLDGVVAKRNLGTIRHSLMQGIVSVHLSRFEQSGRFEVLLSCRTRITPSRYRVPDVMAVPKPLDYDVKFYEGIPVTIVEILSQEDRVHATLQRFADYEGLGVRFNPLMDPVGRATYLYQSGSLIQKELEQLEMAPEPIPFDTEALYAEMDD